MIELVVNQTRRRFDGDPATPLADLKGKSITTIEGLGAKGLHPLQAAWIEHAVPQCGYCQSGQIMQAASLLQSKPHPSDSEIDSASGRKAAPANAAKQDRS
ncbi:MAG: hypothetical protein DMD75_02300 [Candidatus Rokuibacteriota bacterium]|nr:MAG: hypothetical protein DMD75_02300 [Candidatus Rokubacteria bacterium]